ncbi:hypothetical protein [Vibrio mediterranei]|uniref:hypothetical protein n=1 Tax=Vibrio mediterranei TaxID=689 RepID=UPI0002EE2C4E|nr:hypothetical protein [Vibrio mediterranei]
MMSNKVGRPKVDDYLKVKRQSIQLSDSDMDVIRLAVEVAEKATGEKYSQRLVIQEALKLFLDNLEIEDEHQI